MLLTTHQAVLLYLYYYLQGTRFNRAQFAQVMTTHNNLIQNSIDNTSIKSLITMPDTIATMYDQEAPYLAHAVGLAVSSNVY